MKKYKLFFSILFIVLSPALIYGFAFIVIPHLLGVTTGWEALRQAYATCSLEDRGDLIGAISFCGALIYVITLAGITGFIEMFQL